MSVYALQKAKRLKAAGESLGREEMSKRVLALVAEIPPSGLSYKEAMRFAGRMKAICQAAKADEYWTEQVEHGFSAECEHITRAR